MTKYDSAYNSKAAVMFYPGIKLGPTDWLAKLNQSKTRYAEIWYRVDKPEWYHPLFLELQRRGVAFGLHFWGVTSQGFETNLCYPGEIQQESIQLINQCLAQAAHVGAAYVNIHSGNRLPLHLNFDTETLIPSTVHRPIDDAQASAQRDQALAYLSHAAADHRIHLLVEPIPSHSFSGTWGDGTARLHALNQYPTSLAGLLTACENRLIGFTNDFCHVFAMQVGLDRDQLYRSFLTTTKTFAPFTRLIHINTLYRPYNGTDAHGGILARDFDKPGVFPTRQEFVALLNLFRSSTQPVWLIGEPSDHHVENFTALLRLLQLVK